MRDNPPAMCETKQHNSPSSGALLSTREMATQVWAVSRRQAVRSVLTLKESYSPVRCTAQFLVTFLDLAKHLAQCYLDTRSTSLAMKSAAICPSLRLCGWRSYNKTFTCGSEPMVYPLLRLWPSATIARLSYASTSSGSLTEVLLVSPSSYERLLRWCLRHALGRDSSGNWLWPAIRINVQMYKSSECFGSTSCAVAFSRAALI